MQVDIKGIVNEPNATAAYLMILEMIGSLEAHSGKKGDTIKAKRASEQATKQIHLKIELVWLENVVLCDNLMSLR